MEIVTGKNELLLLVLEVVFFVLTNRVFNLYNKNCRNNKNFILSCDFNFLMMIIQSKFKKKNK